MTDHRSRCIAAERDDACHLGHPSRGEHADGVTGLDLSAAHHPHEAAKILVRAIDPLHRHAKGAPLGGGGIDFHRLQILEERGSHVPGRSLGLLHDVVALQPGDRNGQESLDADTPRERGVIGNDGIVGAAVVADQIHLVHGEHEIADADEVRKIAMAPRLGEHTFACIDQNDGEIRGRCTGDHVARVLLVPGRVGYDELAPVGGEESIGHIDGDPLLTLGGETVDQEREVDALALRADALAVRLQCRELILEQHLAVVQEPSDERRFSVVHGAAGDEPQQRFALMLREVGVDVLGGELRGPVGGLGSGVRQK